MKKRVSVIIGLCLLTISLAACSKSAAKTADQGASQENAEVKTTEVAASGGEATKPETITMMVDGTFVTADQGQEEFEKQWEAQTGIDLQIIQPDHDVYYDEVAKAFETGDLPDVILLSSTYYMSYAAQEMLADITSYYADSDLQKAVDANGKTEFVDALRINGRLYGISPTRGNGCTTYVKKTWLDNVGLGVPTNYTEYMEMLKAFSEGDPDGDGVMGNTYGVSAAGLMNNEAPYVNYLPEFFQDAYPSFYEKEDGTWADGFMDDNMKDALNRLRDAYSKGYMDPNIADNSTGDCRDKFFANEYGVFTYWAGTWAKTLSDNLVAAGVNGEIVTIPPIAETGKYLERVAPVWCITSACKNPAGVYKYFLETMNDGGAVEEMWTYSPATDDFTKNHIDHLLATVPLANDPGAESVTEDQTVALQIFNDNSRMADLPYSTEAYSLFNDQLMELKKELMKKVVIDGVDIESAYADFESANGAYMSQAIVDSLNAE